MLIDVSVPLRADLPSWPGEAGLERRLKSSLDAGDAATVSHLALGAHTGTHMDGPNHFVAGASGIDELPLEALVGPCWVVDLSFIASGPITSEHLEASGIPEDTERLLARTRNSPWAADTSFREDFCAYDASAAEWCVDMGLLLVGIDYLSIEPFGSGPIGHPTHMTLLRAGIAVVEGVDLDGVDDGAWEIMALPLKIPGGDGAPARVVLRR